MWERLNQFRERRRGPDRRSTRRGPDRRSSRTSLAIEGLESRMVLYSATGNAWLNPSVITISFMPDGTDLGGVKSNMQAAFDRNPYLAGRWKDEILKAAQVWAQQTDINFVVVPDDGAPAGEVGFQQGSPTHGDIRIGGFNYGTSTLAEAVLPPPVNNYSIAGDIVFNTGMPFNIGMAYDLFTVASHEVGHALGLGESSAYSSAVMWPLYVSRKIALAPDDIAGIRSIYSGGQPRAADRFGNLNNSLNTAADVTGAINPDTLTGLVPGQDITVAGQLDHFSFVAPAGSGGKMTVAVQSDGLSLLSPRVTVYAADKTTVLGMAVGMRRYGTTVSVSVDGVVDGATYYVRVQGAEPTALGTGKYALGLGFNGAAPPRQASSVIAFAEGSQRHSGGGTANQSDDGLVSAIPVIMGIGPDTGTSASDGVTGSDRITVRGTAAPGYMVSVYSNGALLGATLADATGKWVFDARSIALPPGQSFLTASASFYEGRPKAKTAYDVIINKRDFDVSDDGSSIIYVGQNASTAAVKLPGQGTTESSDPYTLVVDNAAPATPTIGGITSYTGTNWDGSYNVESRAQTFYGRAEVGSSVRVTANGSPLGEVVADRNGNWSLAISSGLVPGQTYQIKAQATDLAGNATSWSSSLVIRQRDDDAAVVKSDLVVSAVNLLGGLLSGLGDLLSLGGSSTISGQAKAGTRVAVLVDSVVVGVADVGLLGNWSFDTSALGAGTHRLSFRVFDKDGNYGNDSGLLSILV